jgi:hypothetical protein
MTGIALPRARRRRRKPFGPREKEALRFLCVAAFFIVLHFGQIVAAMAGGKVNVETGIETCLIVAWCKLVVPHNWKVIRAWLDSGDDA